MHNTIFLYIQDSLFLQIIFSIVIVLFSGAFAFSWLIILLHVLKLLCKTLVNLRIEYEKDRKRKEKSIEDMIHWHTIEQALQEELEALLKKSTEKEKGINHEQ